MAVVGHPSEITYFTMGKAGDFKVIIDGESASLGLGNMMPEDVQIPHRHPNEQMGYCVAGQCELTVEGVTYLVKPGCTYHIPPNAEHSWHAVGNERFSYIDFFTPKREDLLNGEFNPASLYKDKE